MTSSTDSNITNPPLIYSVSLATFDLHVGNTIAYTFPLRNLTGGGSGNTAQQQKLLTSEEEDVNRTSSPNFPTNLSVEPVHPSNIIGGARLHDYCFPDGGHDVSSDEVSFLVRLKHPVSPFFNEQPQPQEDEDIENNNNQEELKLEESSPVVADNNSEDGSITQESAAKELLLESNDALSENVAKAISDPSTASPVLMRKSANSSPFTTATTTAIDDNNFLHQPISILYGSALYARASDPKVERGALQRSILVLSRVPLNKPILDFLRLRALPLLSNAPEYKNDDPRLKTLVDETYRDLCEMTSPCVSSFRITTPLWAEFDAGNKVNLPRVGRTQSPASPLVLLGYRASVTNLLRMLGPTHAALLLHAIISRIPVIVVGKSAGEVCTAVCAAIHLCRPLPISIGHFAPYAPISVLDKLIAQASTTPFALVGATNAFVAHKNFKGIVKLLLPSIVEEVLASSAAGGDDSSAAHLKASSRGGNAAFVQYPQQSTLHKLGPAKFLPKTFMTRVKRLLAFAQEPDASEAHVRSLALALNFALSLEIRSGYGDVGAAFTSKNGAMNVISSPLRDVNSTRCDSSALLLSEELQQKKEDSPPRKEEEEQQQVLDDNDSFDFIPIDSEPSLSSDKNIGNLVSFPALKSREEETRLMNSLEMALRSFLTERANERKTVLTIQKWFGACRTMLVPIAEFSSPTQKMLFEDLMPHFASIENAVQYDLSNLHNDKEDAGMLFTCEDMLLTLGEQQRLCRVDLARLVEHYRRRAGAAVDMLCSKQNIGVKSRDVNQTFCDSFNFPGTESYEMLREVLLAQATANATISPCESGNIDENDNGEPPAPYWKDVDVTLYLSSRFLCLDAANQSITSKAISRISKILPKSTPGQKQLFENGFYSQQVFPIASVARIEVLEDEEREKHNQQYGGGGGGGGASALTQTVIPRGFDLHTIRLHLYVPAASTFASFSNNNDNNNNSKSTSSTSTAKLSQQQQQQSNIYPWRAKLDIKVSQRAGMSQLLFLLVNKHHDFTQAIRRMMSPTVGPTSALANHNTQQCEGFYIGPTKHIICPVALCGPAKLRDVPSVTRDEIYENQRFYPIAGWSSRLMPHDPPAWSDRSGMRFKPKEQFVNPPLGYEWCSEWSLVNYYDDLKPPEGFEKEEHERMNNNTDGGWAAGEENWVYGTFWTLADFRAKKFPICSIRRRRWVRQRRFVPELMARLKEEQDKKLTTVDASKYETQENEVNNSLAFASHLKTLEHITDVKAELGEQTPPPQ